MNIRLRSCWGFLLPVAMTGLVSAAEDSIEAPPLMAVSVAGSLQAQSEAMYQETRNTAADARFHMDTRTGDTSEVFEAWLRERGLTVVGATEPEAALVERAEVDTPELLATRSEESCNTSVEQVLEPMCVTPECSSLASRASPYCFTTILSR